VVGRRGRVSARWPATTAPWCDGSGRRSNGDPPGSGHVAGSGWRAEEERGPAGSGVRRAGHRRKKGEGRKREGRKERGKGKEKRKRKEKKEKENRRRERKIRKRKLRKKGKRKKEKKKGLEIWENPRKIWREGFRGIFKFRASA
jgi:hypothetical protein